MQYFICWGTKSIGVILRRLRPKARPVNDMLVNERGQIDVSSASTLRRIDIIMMKEERKLTLEHNQAIIKLIKHKFKPLQHSKFSLHHSTHLQPSNPRNTVSGSMHPQVSFPSLPSSPCQPLSEKTESEANLVQKARSYVQNKRQGKPHVMEKGELSEYIQLFEKKIEAHERAKRDSIELSFAEFDNRPKLEPLAAVRTDYE